MKSRYKRSTCQQAAIQIIPTVFAHPCGMAKDVVPGLSDNDHPPSLVNEPSRKGKRRCRHTVQLLVLATFLWWFWSWIIPFRWPSLSLRQSTVLPFGHVPDIGFPESLMRTWAQYAPYIPVAKYVPPPPACTISQVSTR